MNFLKEQIKLRIEGIDKKRLNYRQRAHIIFISIALLSALTTIILGLNVESLSELVRITALIFTSTITILSTYTAYYNHKDLWIVNTVARNKLYKLLFDIEFAEDQKIDLSPTQKDTYKIRYQEILDELNGAWQKGKIEKS